MIERTHRPKTRGDLLADLAAAVNELVEPRHHTEFLIKTVTEPVEQSHGRKKSKRTRRRDKHTVTLPGLLEALLDAAVPGSTDAGGIGGTFESRPPAELEAIAVLREVAVGVQDAATKLDVIRPTLAGMLHALVGARHTDDQLRALVRDAQRWVRRARIATGFDAAPITLGDPCPYCLRRNALVVTGDLTTAHCQRCGVEWDHDTIGLLAEMLRANTEQQTAVDVHCHWPECGRRGVHLEHVDPRGRTWRDTCDVNDPRHGWALGKSADDRGGPLSERVSAAE